MIAALADPVPEPSSEFLDYLQYTAVQYAETHLAKFIPMAWHVIEPFTPYRPNWHIDEICAYLEAVEAGEIRNLLVTMPPRMLKSISISVMYPAWRWILKPWIRFMYSSYASDLATEHSVATRRIIQSPFYQRWWGSRFQMSYDANLKTRFENNYMGVRVATSVGGLVTGRGGDRIIIDDPHNVRDADSDTKRKDAITWWDKSMSTRFNNPDTGARIIVMQRVHFEDLAGHVLEQGGYTHLNLPMEFEPRYVITNPWGRGDPRHEPGELLAPNRVKRADVEDLKKRLGSRSYNGQFQQRPAPAEGGTFKKVWWNYWHPAGREMRPVDVVLADGSVTEKRSKPLPVAFSETLQSWDMTFKETSDADYVAGQVWAYLGADCFLLDQSLAQMDFPKSVAAVKAMKLRYPHTQHVLIEDKANGPAVVSTLQHQIPGLVAVNPLGGKVVRANAVTYLVEAGNVYLPHPDLCDWVEGFIEDAAGFPDAKYDDQVDAMSQALARLESLMAASMEAPEGVDGDTLFSASATELGSDASAWEDDPWA